MRSLGDFLFEIGCEEIPAEMIPKASRELKAILEKYFLTNGLLEEKSRAVWFRLRAVSGCIRKM
jgi:glycyl-tRNA synthetase beta subunit